MGPYEIMQKIDKVAYELKLPKELDFVYPVFHVYMLKKCIGDPEFIIPIVGLGVKETSLMRRSRLTSLTKK